jgi:hypothetical protein
MLSLIPHSVDFDMLPLLYAGIGFIWKPVAILAAFMTGISIAFLNDRYNLLNYSLRFRI